MLIIDEIENTKKIGISIYEHREKKILLAAISKARGGNPDLKNIIQEEKILFDSVYELILNSRKSTIDIEKLDDDKEPKAIELKKESIQENKTEIKQEEPTQEIKTEEKQEENSGKQHVFPLAALALLITCRKIFDHIHQTVKIPQKKVDYSPSNKRVFVIIGIMSGCEAVFDLNRKLRRAYSDSGVYPALYLL